MRSGIRRDTFIRIPKRLLVAIGGNAVHPETTSGTVAEQREYAERTASSLLPLMRLGNELVRDPRQRPRGRQDPDAPGHRATAGWRRCRSISASPTARAGSPISCCRRWRTRCARVGECASRGVPAHPGRGRPGRSRLREPDQADRLFLLRGGGAGARARDRLGDARGFRARLAPCRRLRPGRATSPIFRWSATSPRRARW